MKAYKQSLKYKEYMREYNKLPSQKEYQRQYKHSPQGKAADARSQHKRKSNMKNLPCDLTAQEWEEIKKSQNYRCALCGKTKSLARDHIIPLSRGGAFTKDNIQGLCKSCNSIKHTKTMEEVKMMEDFEGEKWEQMTGQEVEDALIATYVPEAGQMSREDALALALQRDEEFAMEFDVDWEEEDDYLSIQDLDIGEEDEDGE
jgi:5-methylcytosine-specific restriction endonuclease McrA